MGRPLTAAARRTRVLDRLGPALVPHLRQRHIRVIPGEPIGAEVHAGVALDADEVVAGGRPQEDVLQHLLGRIAQRLAALCRP